MAKANWENVGCINSIMILCIFFMVFVYFIGIFGGLAPAGIFAFVIFIDYYVLTADSANGSISERGNWRRKLYHRIAIFVILTAVGLGIFTENYPDIEYTFRNVEFLTGARLLAVLSFVLAISIPLLSKIIKGILSFKFDSIKGPNPSWFLNKIVAPTIVGSLIGLVSYYYTGDFNFGSPPSQLTIFLMVVSFIGSLIFDFD